MTSARRPRPATAATLAAVLAAACATGFGYAASAQFTHAQSIGAEADITGDWEFETKIYVGGCKMTGEMTIERSETEGQYVGQLIAREKCSGFVDENGEPLGDIEYYAEQSVVATRDGDQIYIDATLELVLPSPDNYWPDDFELEIVDSALMMGALRSYNDAPVAFFRGDAPIA
ncbi:MAG: hypothetical protein PVI23_14620 [Maricaulaceae bacterium]|jgi:hypothetical protein